MAMCVCVCVCVCNGHVCVYVCVCVCVKWDRSLTITNNHLNVTTWLMAFSAHRLEPHCLTANWLTHLIVLFVLKMIRQFITQRQFKKKIKAIGIHSYITHCLLLLNDSNKRFIY